jgi:hypothetical protein
MAGGRSAPVHDLPVYIAYCLESGRQRRAHMTICVARQTYIGTVESVELSGPSNGVYEQP